jgi:hypothetical protein
MRRSGVRFPKAAQFDHLTSPHLQAGRTGLATPKQYEPKALHATFSRPESHCRSQAAVVVVRNGLIGQQSAVGDWG